MTRDKGASITPAQSARASEEPEARSAILLFIDKVRSRYANNIEVYIKFAESIRDYHETSMSVSQAHEKVRVLFRDSPDILDDFERLIPGNAETPKDVMEEVSEWLFKCKLAEDT